MNESAQSPVQAHMNRRSDFIRSTRRHLRGAAVLIFLAGVAGSSDANAAPAELKVVPHTPKVAIPGMKAPAFDLDRMTDGHVRLSDLKEKKTVLVVGLTRESAPRCKEWTAMLLKRLGDVAHVYNVVVADKAWYIPKSAVRYKLRQIVPEYARDYILVEWGKAFGQRYDIVKDDIPTVFILDRSHTIELRFKGLMNRESLGKIVAQAQARPAIPAKPATATANAQHSAPSPVEGADEATGTPGGTAVPPTKPSAESSAQL